jgi:hypothetical protein
LSYRETFFLGAGRRGRLRYSAVKNNLIYVGNGYSLQIPHCQSSRQHISAFDRSYCRSDFGVSVVVVCCVLERRDSRRNFSGFNSPIPVI